MSGDYRRGTLGPWHLRIRARPLGIASSSHPSSLAGRPAADPSGCADPEPAPAAATDLAARPDAPGGARNDSGQAPLCNGRQTPKRACACYANVDGSSLQHEAPKTGEG